MVSVFSLCLIFSTITQAQQKDSIATGNASIGLVGSGEDVTTNTEAGFVLAGGGKDVDAAMKWMIDRSGGGDFVIIRASGFTGYNDYLFELGKLNSVETLLIDTREKAMNKDTGKRIREAEALFIAGGDQWNYVNYWNNSEVSEAIKYLIEEKKVPIGGTSAGCAVLSEFIFDARNDTVVSADALTNPYEALRVYIYQATPEGTPAFNLTHWPKKNPNEYWSVSEGALTRFPLNTIPQ